MQKMSFLIALVSVLFVSTSASAITRTIVCQIEKNVNGEPQTVEAYVQLRGGNLVVEIDMRVVQRAVLTNSGSEDAVLNYRVTQGHFPASDSYDILFSARESGVIVKVDGNPEALNCY